MKINLLVEGGNMQPGPTLSQKIGPLGVNMGQIIQQANKSTENFKGMKVPIEVEIDSQTKEIKVHVFSPPVSELVKKELGLEKGSGEQKKLRVGNASIEQIISVAKNKLPNIISKDLKSAVKEVVGTCVSLGLLIENKPAKEFMEDIVSGKYDKEIKEEKIEISPEKIQRLKENFEAIKREQELKIKQEEIKEAEEATKAEAPSEEEVSSGGKEGKESPKKEVKPKEQKEAKK